MKRVTGDALEGAVRASKAKRQQLLQRTCATAYSFDSCSLVLGRDPQAHRNHRRINKTVMAEKFLRHIFRPVGQQRNAKKIFLFGKIDRVLEKLRAVTLALNSLWTTRSSRSITKPPSAVLMVNSKLIIPTIAPFRRKTKTRPRLGCSKISRRPAKLFFLVGTEIAFLGEQFAEHFRQFVQIGFGRRLDHHMFFFAHCLHCLFQKSDAPGNRN